MNWCFRTIARPTRRQEECNAHYHFSNTRLEKKNRIRSTFAGERFCLCSNQSTIATYRLLIEQVYNQISLPTCLILSICSVASGLHHWESYLSTNCSPGERKRSNSPRKIHRDRSPTFNAARECNGTPSSYLPDNKPHANGDQVIVPMPRDEHRIENSPEDSGGSNQSYERSLEDGFPLYHVERDGIPLVRRSVESDWIVERPNTLPERRRSTIAKERNASGYHDLHRWPSRCAPIEAEIIVDHLGKGSDDFFNGTQWERSEERRRVSVPSIGTDASGLLAKTIST